MLVHIKKVLEIANKKKIAIGAFNTANLETTLGIIRAAAKTKSPIIIQVSESTIHYAGLENIFSIIKSVAQTDGKNVPIAVHLDHGKDYELVKACVDVGFSSVHMDASSFPFEENIKLTKRAADYGRKRGAFVQGELGSLIGKEGSTVAEIPKDKNEYMTNPDKAAEFVRRTGVDTLAISVGAMHGFFPGKEKIDMARLKKITAAVPKIPLVLHGASGLPDKDISLAPKHGVRIVNIDTDLRIAYTETLRRTLAKWPKKSYDPRKILAPSIEAISAAAEKIIKLASR